MNLAGLFAIGHDDFFLVIKPVAMDNRIVHRLGEADQNIGIQVFVQALFGHEALDKILHFADATGMRGQFQYVDFCSDED